MKRSLKNRGRKFGVGEFQCGGHFDKETVLSDEKASESNAYKKTIGGSLKFKGESKSKKSKKSKKKRKHGEDSVTI